MTRIHWPKILISVAVLGIILTVSHYGGQISPTWSGASPTWSGASPAAPLSPLTFFSSPLPPAEVQAYLPAITRNARGPHLKIYLPLIMHHHPRATSSPTPVISPLATPSTAPRTDTVGPPAPLPTPDWPPALSQPGSSKLGLHVIQNNSPDIMEFVRRTKPAVVKGLGGFGWAIDVKRVSPETVTVGRLLEDADEGIMTGDPEKAAQNFVARHLEEYRLNSGVDYWEGWNEPVSGGHMAWYARFEAERTRRMADHGLRVAIGGFATGMPEWDEFVEFLPAIEVALAHDGILTLHEYAAPTLDYRVGEGLPGHPVYPDRGVLTLRYRWWYEDILKPRGLVIPLVISEGGIDGQVDQDLAPPGLGWRDFTKYWRQQGLGEVDPTPGGVDPTSGGADAQIYIQQLAWYDRQLQQDDYVTGVAIFTAGSPAGHWPSFDITAILPELAKYVVSQQEQ